MAALTKESQTRLYLVGWLSVTEAPYSLWGHRKTIGSQQRCEAAFQGRIWLPHSLYERVGFYRRSSYFSVCKIIASAMTCRYHRVNSCGGLSRCDALRTLRANKAYNQHIPRIEWPLYLQMSHKSDALPKKDNNWHSKAPFWQPLNKIASDYWNSNPSHLSFGSRIGILS